MGVLAYKRAWSAPYTGNSKLLLLALAEFIGDGKSTCYPSIATLADMVGVGERQVQRLIDQLETAGAIAVQRGRGRNHTSVYAILTGLSPDEHEKVTCDLGKGDIKGDIAMSPLPEEKVTFSAEKVTFEAIKGDIAMSPEPEENRSNQKRERSAPPRTPPTPKQISLSRLSEACQIVESAFGRKLNPAMADAITDLAIDDYARWQRNVSAYAAKYERLNIPALKDWYTADKAKTNGASNGLGSYPQASNGALRNGAGRVQQHASPNPERAVYREVSADDWT